MKDFDLWVDHEQKMLDLTNNFLKEYLKLHRESDLDEEEMSDEERVRQADVFGFNIKLVQSLMQTDYVKDKTFGYIDQPLIGWGFTESIVKESFLHNIKGFLDRFNYTVENLDKKHDDYSEYTIKSNKVTTTSNSVTRHFTVIDTHSDEKFKCQFSLRDNKYQQFILFLGKEDALVIGDESGDVFDPVTERFKRTERVDHIRYRFTNEINSFFHVFYAVFHGVEYGITGKEWARQ